MRSIRRSTSGSVSVSAARARAWRNSSPDRRAAALERARQHLRGLVGGRLCRAGGLRRGRQSRTSDRSAAPSAAGAASLGRDRAARGSPPHESAPPRCRSSAMAVNRSTTAAPLSAPQMRTKRRDRGRRRSRCLDSSRTRERGLDRAWCRRWPRSTRSAASRAAAGALRSAIERGERRSRARADDRQAGDRRFAHDPRSDERSATSAEISLEREARIAKPWRS